MEFYGICNFTGKIDSLLESILFNLVFLECNKIMGKVTKFILENLSYLEKIIIKMLILSGKKFGIKG